MSGSRSFRWIVFFQRVRGGYSERVARREVRCGQGGRTEREIPLRAPLLRKEKDNRKGAGGWGRQLIGGGAKADREGGEE